MSKLAYAILITLLLAAAVYAFRPTNEEVAAQLFTGAPPKSFTLRANGLVQEVTDGKRVKLAGLDRAIAEKRESGPWGMLASVRLVKGKTVEGVGESQLAAYGLGPERELVADGVFARWGEKDGTGYVWNGTTRQLVVLPPGMAAAIDKGSERMDDPKLVTLDPSPSRIDIDGLAVTPGPNGWLATVAPQRPAFDQRIGRLMGLISELKLDKLAGEPINLLPLASTIVVTPAAKSADQTPLTIRLHKTGYGPNDGGLVAVGSLPAQPIDPATMRQWNEAIAAMKTDPLFEIARQVRNDDIVSIIVREGVSERYRLARREKVYESDAYSWDLVWPGGRDDAAPDAMLRVLGTVNDLFVDQVQAIPGLATLSPLALQVEIHHGRKDVEQILVAAIDGNRAASSSHAGLLKDAEAVRQRLKLEAMLDTRLIRRDPTRISKIQRIDHAQAAFQEVINRSEGGAWTRSFPAAPVPPPVDAGAIDRLVRVLVGAQLTAVRFPTAADRAILSDPEVEFDLRFAANSAGKQANADNDIDETANQDVGWALRQVDGRWRGIDRDGLLAFELNATVVDEIRRPFDVGTLYPVVPTLVKRAEIRRGDSVVALVRDGAQWTVAVDGGEARPADEIAVRRWFRALGALRATSIDARAVAFPAQRVEASVICTQPGLDGSGEQVVLQIGITEVGRKRQVHIGTSQLASRFPIGRAEPVEFDSEAVLPTAATFAP